jgi:stage II sporulation protein AA (anti-sigma F factor antagonist)
VGSRWFVAERVGDALVLTFTQADLLDQETVRGIREGVLGLLESREYRRLVLDFSGVRTLSSTMLGLLVALTKRAQQAGGDLTLCSLAPDLHDKFQTTRLHQFFRICPDRQAALPAS